MLMTVFTTCHEVKAQFVDEVAYSPEQTTVKVFAPQNALSVKMRLYDTAIGGTPLETIELVNNHNDTWQTSVKGDLKGLFYTFDTGNGECAGLFAKAVGVNGQRGAIVDMRLTDPEGWGSDTRPYLKTPVDMVIYELHHRDFSMDKSSGIEHKGKFLALTETKAISHLKRLGVNAVHILPSFDYASVDETRLNSAQYNWGYDPVNYNVPDGSYSTDPYRPDARIREFKKMVKALHDAGINVILDVVYNHTFDIKNSNFQKMYPDYFYRKTADGSYSNGSGCGNETASEREMTRCFMVESVMYWVNEYHIDGFRFDLMGVHDIETMNAIRAALDTIDPRIMVYGEGWSAGACAYPQSQLGMKANMKRMPGIAAFSDEMRDALRGPFSNDSEGAFLAGITGFEESLKFGIAGCIEHSQIDMSKVNYSKQAWAAEPTQMIAYVSCHDDMCLTDRLRASVPDITDDELIRLDLLAQTAVFTSQGVPFMLCGEEMLRDKKGVHNSFNSPDSVNHLDWGNLKRHPEVFDYYSKLIAMRRNHPAFRLGTAEAVRQSLEFLPAEDCVVAFTLKGNAGGDRWKDITVILNSNRKSVKVKVPQGRHVIVCRDGKIDEKGLKTVSGQSVSVPARSALIFHNAGSSTNQ